jgi:hypothetical protein
MSLSNVGNVSVAVPRAVLMAASILLFAGIASAQPVVNLAAVPPAPVGEETPIILVRLRIGRTNLWAN